MFLPLKRNEPNSAVNYRSITLPIVIVILVMAREMTVINNSLGTLAAIVTGGIGGRARDRDNSTKGLYRFG